MNIESLWRWIWALPAMGLLGLGGIAATNGQPAHQAIVRTTAPSPHVLKPTGTPAVATPTATVHTPTPAAPKPTVIPTAAAAPTVAAGEIASEQACPGQSSVASTSTALTCLTSNARVFHGLTATSASPALMAAAASKNADMLACGYGHTACGKVFNYWMTNKGFTGQCTGENIAQGQQSPREVFTAWMNSPGHRANILNKDFRGIGVSEVASSSGPMWVMELGGC